MARTLKVFKTHIGFYDLIVSAPSMKAAAAAWNVTPRIFAHELAAATADPDAVSAAMARPGTVLKRLHGRKGDFVPNPAPPSAPRRSAREREQADKARQRQQRLRKALERRERQQAERQAKEAAKAQLADLARQEAALRKKRQALKKQFHLHT